MKLRGGGLLLLSVALAGLDISVAHDKSFATTKNAASIGGGAGGAGACAAVGLAVGGPVGGLIGLVVGGVIGSYAAEEAHFAIRGLHSRPDVDVVIKKYHGLVSFDEEGFGLALHTEFLGDLEAVFIAFSHLDEKRNSDADDVAAAYIEVAQAVCRKYPNGALMDALRSPPGQALLQLLYGIQDDGWTTADEKSPDDLGEGNGKPFRRRSFRQGSSVFDC